MHIISRIWESGFSLSSYNVPNYVLLELLSPSKHCFKIRTGRGGDSVIAKMITLGKSKTIDLVAQGVKEELVSSNILQKYNNNVCCVAFENEDSGLTDGLVKHEVGLRPCR